MSNLHTQPNRSTSARRAVVISAALALVVGLLSNVVANLIHVPAGWEWLPVVALAVTFILALWVQLRGVQPQERGAGQEIAGMKTEVARGATLIGSEWRGDVANVIVKGTQTSSEDDRADKH